MIKYRKQSKCLHVLIFETLGCWWHFYVLLVWKQMMRTLTKSEWWQKFNRKLGKIYWIIICWTSLKNVPLHKNYSITQYPISTCYVVKHVRIITFIYLTYNWIRFEVCGVCKLGNDLNYNTWTWVVTKNPSFKEIFIEEN